MTALAVRLALQPLDAMAHLAKGIAGGRRGLRLAPTRTDTELGQTAQAFDEMLDELEERSSGPTGRGADPGVPRRTQLQHQLRTPITGVQAAGTLLHHDDQLDHDQRQHLEALLIREAQRAGAPISDLLAAARLDAQGARLPCSRSRSARWSLRRWIGCG